MPTRVFSAIRQLLLERDVELEVIDAALVNLASGRGGLVAIEGPPGVGKSSLLRSGRARAEELDLLVLSAEGDEHETSLAFGGALQLFEQPLRHLEAAIRERALAGPARLASVLFDPVFCEPTAFDPGRSAAIAYGLTWLVANLVECAASRPALLLVDDAHLLDSASLRFLRFLAHRLGELPVGILLAYRPGLSAASPELSGLSQLGELLCPAQLSDDAVDVLIRLGLLAVSVDPRFVKASAEVTGGNPFLVQALVEELCHQGVEPDAQAAERVATLVPDSVIRAVVARTAKLGRSAIRLARSVAILGESASLGAVACLAEISLGEAAELADELASAGILEPCDVLRFRHQLIRSAIEAEHSDAARAAAELRAAEVLSELGEVPEKIATHLLAAVATGSSFVAETLEGAATQALRRGAPELAAAYLRRALAEPPPEAARGRLLSALVSAEAAAGLPEAMADLEQALSFTESPLGRAELLRGLGRLLAAGGRHVEALATFERALAELDSREPFARELKADVTSTLASSGGSVPTARAVVEELRGPGAPVASPAAEHEVLALAASQQALAGEPVAAFRDLAFQATEAGLLVARVSEDGGLALTPAAVALLYADELERSRALLDAAAVRASSDGSLTAVATVSYLRAWPEYFSGELASAAGDLHWAIGAFAQGWGLHALAAFALLAHVELERGDLSAVRAALEQGEVLRATTESWAASVLEVASARLHLVEHEPERALKELEACRQLLAEQGVSDRAIPWRCTASAAALALGDRALAIAYASEELARATRIGAARTYGMALRCFGVAQGVEGGGLASLERAVAVLGESPSRLEFARALVDLGALWRRAGRRAEAVDRLRQGLEMAEALGAKAIAARAQEELRAAGSRPRRTARYGLGSLTPSELRVAELAVLGLMNRQIAGELSVSVKAVEFHLRHVFEKLGISSRKELAASLSVAGRPASERC